MTDLNVKIGLYDFGECSENAKSSLNYIFNDFADIRKRYISLGFHLYEFKSCEYYHDFGYCSFEEFCEANIPMDKSAVFRCMNVWYNFCAVHEDSRKMWLDDKYKNYSYSQLCEMLSMSNELRKKVSPDMTVKQLRELKKRSDTDIYESAKDASESVAMSQQEVFDMSRFVPLRGAAESSYIKKQFADTKTVCLEIFDKNGKRVSGFNNLWVDLLVFKDNIVVIRLCQSEENDIGREE